KLLLDRVSIVRAVVEGFIGAGGPSAAGLLGADGPVPLAELGAGHPRLFRVDAANQLELELGLLSCAALGSTQESRGRQQHPAECSAISNPARHLTLAQQQLTK